CAHCRRERATRGAPSGQSRAELGPIGATPQSKKAAPQNQSGQTRALGLARSVANRSAASSWRPRAVTRRRALRETVVRKTANLGAVDVKRDPWFLNCSMLAAGARYLGS